MASYFSGYTLHDISHADIVTYPKTGNSIKAIIVFSISMSTTENKQLLNSCVSKFNVPLLIIGSTASLSASSEYFKYSRVKRDQMNYSTRYPGLLYGVFGIFGQSSRKGLHYTSNSDSLILAINDLLNSKSGIRDYYSVEGTPEPSYIKNLYNLASQLLGPVITAALFKVFSNYHYGYSRLTV